MNENPYIKPVPFAHSGPNNNSAIDQPLFQFQPSAEEMKDLRQMRGSNIRYDMLEEEEKRDYLGSDARIRAFDQIWAETMPAPLRAQQKQGIVSEVLKKQLLSWKTLRERPTIYLGSGCDLEYPLALGARNLTMVDYGFEDPDYRQSLLDRLSALLQDELADTTSNTLHFPFDFGQGIEEVTLTIEPGIYYVPGTEVVHPEKAYTLPQNVGLILLFAPNGPAGSIRFDDVILESLAPEGALLNQNSFLRLDPASQYKEEIKLGKSID